MGREYSVNDCLRYEFFEILLPEMLYKGTKKEKDEFFELLKQDGKNVICYLYQKIYEDDGLVFPYEKSDFAVELFERGGVNVLQVLIPPYNSDINGILRVYFLFTENENIGFTRRYFIVKRFENGQIFNLYVNTEMEIFLGGNLTDHFGNMEYEYWQLVWDYSKMLILELGLK